MTVRTTVTPAESGTVVLDPQLESYTVGDTVRVTATPTDGYTFVRYGGSIVSATASTTITLTQAMTIDATFQGAKVELTRTIDPEGSGSISVTPSGEVHRGDTLKLTAKPASGYTFLNWEDAKLVKGSRTLVLADDTEVIAHFEKTDASATLQIVNDLPSDGDWAQMNTLVRLRVGSPDGDVENDDDGEMLTAGESSCEPTSVAPGRSRSFEVSALKPDYVIYAQTGLWEYDPFFSSCWDLYITSIHGCDGSCCTSKAATTKVTGHRSGTRVVKLSSFLPNETWEGSGLCEAQ
ncbi:MAG: hypothetical protein H7Z43_02465 [Clostridia bacterium]|nr:hypothetical protein [Deltaproteobacteria bacterium]